jgi:putative flippase GtrA
MHRWIKFGAVGGIGVGVQLAVLAVLTHFGLHYLPATALAVEAALLHNYLWHVRWTWKDRAPQPGQLYRFHLANGLISLISNLGWMRLLTGWLYVPVLPANVVAISATAVLNFLLGDRWVFASKMADEQD